MRTDHLSAAQLIDWIANTHLELSLQPAYYQRDDIVKACRSWVESHSCDYCGALEGHNMGCVFLED